MAEGFAPGIENHGNGRAGIVLLQAADHADNTLDRAGWLVLGGLQGRQRVKGAE